MVFCRRMQVDEADVDELGHASNVAYVRWIQEVAKAHSERAGWAHRQYLKLGAVFVVRRHEIDYLRPALVPLEVWTTCDGARREHHWATAMAALPGASEPFPGFGASDCACASHLVAFPALPPLAAFRRRLRAQAADHAPIRRIAIAD